MENCGEPSNVEIGLRVAGGPTNVEIGLEVCDWAIICWIWFGIWCLAYKLELAYKLVLGHDMLELYGPCCGGG